jgi:hypothetical protein
MMDDIFLDLISKPTCHIYTEYIQTNNLYIILVEPVCIILYLRSVL